MQRFSGRLKRLEAAARPAGQAWTIAVDICEMSADGVLGRTLAHIAPRVIDPSKPFDFDAGMRELLGAMEHAAKEQ